MWLTDDSNYLRLLDISRIVYQRVYSKSRMQELTFIRVTRLYKSTFQEPMLMPKIIIDLILEQHG